MWQYQDDFLDDVGQRSPKTSATYQTGLRSLATWLAERPAGADLLNSADLLAYHAQLAAQRSQATCKTYLAAIMSYLVYLESQGALPGGIDIGFLQRQLARQRPAPAVRNIEELDQARQAGIPAIVAYWDALPLPVANDSYNGRLILLRNRALMHTMIGTAARASEILSLTKAQAGHGRADHVSIIGKGGKRRTIHLRPAAQVAIQAYLAERQDDSPDLFVGHSRVAGNGRMSLAALHGIVKTAVAACDLNPNLSPHDFRHYQATRLLRSGAPLEVVQEYLGHSQITTTRRVYAPFLGRDIISSWLDKLG